MLGYCPMPLIHHLHQRRPKTTQVNSILWTGFFDFDEPRDPLSWMSRSKFKFSAIQSDMMLDRDPTIMIKSLGVRL